MAASLANCHSELVSESSADCGDGVSKSARPDVQADGTRFEYFARAEARDSSGSVVATATGTFGEPGTAAARTFEIALEIGKVWKIICGIKDRSTGAEVFADSIEKEITAEDSVLSCSFYPAPTFDGSGSVALGVSFESPIKGAAVECPDPDWNCAIIDGETETQKVIKSDAIKSGHYEVVLKFLDENGAALYISVQTISVFDSMETDAWVPDGGTERSPIAADGTFFVGEALVQSAQSAFIYVGRPAALAADEGLKASDSNSGHAYEPLKTLSEAARRIAMYGSAATDYKIYISGTVTGPQEIPEALTSAKAKSVTILGLTGLDGNKKPRDSLDAQKGGTTLSVNSTVPITIKNLLITGGSHSGIRTKNGANCVLTLADGALVAGNSMNGAGGGIYHGGGKLFMIGWACVGDPNAASCAQSDEASSNHGTHGGGIYVRTGSKFFMGYSDDDTLCECTGGIFYNYSSNTAPTSASQDDAGGGGIDISNGSVKIASGTIKYNGAARAGGGVATSVGTIEISGGTICDNKAAQFGGGVYIGKYDAYNPKLKISGGTVIKANQAPNGGAVYFDPAGSSALFSLSVAASLPYADAKNDIYLADGKTITVAGPLTSQETVAAITPANWKRGTKVLEAGSGVTDLTASAAKFALTAPAEDEWQKILSASKTKVTINAPIYVGANSNPSPAGTRSDPFTTIARACQEMDDASCDYKINVNGTVAGAQSVPATIQANTLTICGKNGLYTSGTDAGKPKDALDAQGSGTTLSILTDVAVTIKDLRITGASNGGIYVDNDDADVELLGGTFVTANEAVSGGGINVAAGSLKITGAVISGNSATNDGGGIYNNGSVTFNSGSIESNSALFSGGGLYNDGSFEMKDGCSITENSANDGGDGTLSSGGGVFAAGGSFAVSGGTISANSTNGQGGAVYVYDGDFSVGGSASIPYGTGNDVTMFEGMSIGITAPLAGHSGSNQIRLTTEFTEGAQVLSGETGVTLASEVPKFLLTQPIEGTDLFFISSAGKLATFTPIFTFDNGTEDGFKTNPIDNLDYNAVKYSYISYENLKASAVNPYEDSGFTIELLVDGDSGDSTARTIDDGFHTLTMRVSKTGYRTVGISKRVYAKIKPVKVQISEMLRGWYRVSPEERPCPDQTFYLQAENPDDEYSDEQSFYLGYSTGDGYKDGDHARNYYWWTPGDSNYVWMTAKTSVFYFWANQAYDYVTHHYMEKFNKECPETTRTLEGLKSNRSFDSQDRNGDGVWDSNAWDRSRVWITVSLNDSEDPPAP